MASHHERGQAFSQEDHQVAYVFEADGEGSRPQHAPKRRRVSKQRASLSAGPEAAGPCFVPLLGGAETAEHVQARERLFRESWGMVDARIQNALRESNSATLEEVAAFVGEAQVESYDNMPCVFVRTGSNIASQNLLFEQLSDRLQRSTTSKFVRLRSSEVATLKATLKRIIHDVVRREDGDEDEDEDEIQLATKYLDYDLEALRFFVKSNACDHVFVAFEDSEGFDSTLLSDLIPLLNSWRPRIPFTLLFGIATSVELLQARLLKTTCQQIYGAQFDAVQTDAILETIFKMGVSAADVPLRLGSPLLRSMLDRQRDQMAGIQAFISSLKYAYMCHFYANPLSSLMSGPPALQPEHIESLRNTPSFRAVVERLVESDDAEQLSHAQSLLENDTYLAGQLEKCAESRQRWVDSLLRSILIAVAAGAATGEFSDIYCRAVLEGIDDSDVTEQVRRMDAVKLVAFIRQVLSIFRAGDSTLKLGPYEGDDDLSLELSLKKLQDGIEALDQAARAKSVTLRSKYMGQTKVVRTTVIAQRVQLSRDSAALSDEDRQYTELVDEVASLLSRHVAVAPVSHVLGSECWAYDSTSPARDVFVPRPRATFERGLTRPHDYLSCSCCKEDSSGIQATLPATSILYQLYLETGSLINVADLWTAFRDIVGQEEKDERRALLLFYCGLAELRTLGFVKSSKKKADHVAKLKWL